MFVIGRISVVCTHQSSCTRYGKIYAVSRVFHSFPVFVHSTYLNKDEVFRIGFKYRFIGLKNYFLRIAESLNCVCRDQILVFIVCDGFYRSFLIRKSKHSFKFGTVVIDRFLAYEFIV